LIKILIINFHYIIYLCPTLSVLICVGISEIATCRDFTFISLRMMKIMQTSE